MEKYIKVNNDKIVEIREVYETELSEEIKQLFEKEYKKIDIPDSLSDIQVMSQYLYKNNKLVKTDIFLKQQELNSEMLEIYSWLTQNDWVPNKIITNEWSANDKRWTNYLQERASKRTRLDEIKKQLGL